MQCWGWNGYGQADAPVGTFTSVSAGQLHSCGIRTDQVIQCWGSGSARTAVPDGTFVSVSAGSYHSCGVRTDGTVRCWGANDHDQADAPEGTFTSVSAGHDHTCGVRTDRTIQCWGTAHAGRTTPPSHHSSTAVRPQSSSDAADDSTAPDRTTTDPVDNGDNCYVGLVIAPGERCTYPGTTQVFWVDDSGKGHFLFSTSGFGINARDLTFNGVRYNFAAAKQPDGTWIIEAAG